MVAILIGASSTQVLMFFIIESFMSYYCLSPCMWIIVDRRNYSYYSYVSWENASIVFLGVDWFHPISVTSISLKLDEYSGGIVN